MCLWSGRAASSSKHIVITCFALRVPRPKNLIAGLLSNYIPCGPRKSLALQQRVASAASRPLARLPLMRDNREDVRQGSCMSLVSLRNPPSLINMQAYDSAVAHVCNASMFVCYLPWSRKSMSP